MKRLLVAASLCGVGYLLVDHGFPIGWWAILAGLGLGAWELRSWSAGRQAPELPVQAANARAEAQMAIEEAEADAARYVRRARKRAEAEGKAALRRADALLAAEPKWVAR